MVYPTLPLTQKMILVVEDNTQVRQMIARLLEIEGYTIIQASDGSVALSILQRSLPNLILSDINMPNLNGIELYRKVRADARWVAIPFIFLASRNAPNEIQAGRELGVEDYLEKPIDPQGLIKSVSARLLRSYALQIAYMDQAYLETVTVLANTIEGRDHCTHNHVERVAALARSFAKVLQWPAENMRMLEFGARLHDIGKIVVPDQILNKPGQLTPDEWQIMRSHTTAGANILREIKHLQGAVPYALYHHERWDGAGYPFGLNGRDIPLEGRLLSIVDVYDALTSERPYRPALPKEAALKMLIDNAGSQFDPDLTPIFIDTLA
jgi:putative two-component system response regulator